MSVFEPDFTAVSIKGCDMFAIAFISSEANICSKHKLPGLQLVQTHYHHRSAKLLRQVPDPSDQHGDKKPSSRRHAIARRHTSPKISAHSEERRDRRRNQTDRPRTPNSLNRSPRSESYRSGQPSQTQRAQITISTSPSLQSRQRNQRIHNARMHVSQHANRGPH